MLFDVESFKNTYPNWFEPATVEGIIFLSLLFFFFLLVLGICVKHFGSKLIPAATIDIFDRIVRINNRKLDTEERKDLAAELKNKISRFNPPVDEFIIDVDESKFKKSYANINLEFYRRNEDAREEYVLKEGYRYMPLEEIYHVIGLIYRLEAFGLNRDWKKLYNPEERYQSQNQDFSIPPVKVFSLASDPVFTRNFYVLSGIT